MTKNEQDTVRTLRAHIADQKSRIQQLEKARVALEWAVNECHITGNYNCLGEALAAIATLDKPKETKS